MVRKDACINLYKCCRLIYTTCNIYTNIYSHMGLLARKPVFKSAHVLLNLLNKLGKIDEATPVAQLVERLLLERESQLHYTKGVKNGTSCSLADAHIKEVVLGR